MLVGVISSSAGALDIMASKLRSPSARGSWLRWFLLTMMMCRSSGSSGRMPAMRLRSSGAVTRTEAPLSKRRSFTGSGPKAENNGPTMAPSFRAPKRAKYSSGTRAMKQKDAVALLHAEAPQDAGEPVRLIPQLSEGVSLLLAVLAQPDHGELAGPDAVGVPIDALVGLIQASVGKPVQLPVHLLPAKARAGAVHVWQVRQDTHLVRRRLAENRVLHHHDSSQLGAVAIGGGRNAPVRRAAAAKVTNNLRIEHVGVNIHAPRLGLPPRLQPRVAGSSGTVD